MLTMPGHKGNANQNYTKIPLHSCYNSYPQKHHQQQMLVRMWECKQVQPLWKTICRFLKKLNIDLPYDPAIPLLGIYPKGM
jgi:hypothetical protein